MRQIWPATNIKTMKTVENLSRANAKAQNVAPLCSLSVFIVCCAAHRLAVIHRSRRSPPMQVPDFMTFNRCRGIYRQITVSKACP